LPHLLFFRKVEIRAFSIWGSKVDPGFRDMAEELATCKCLEMREAVTELCGHR
jgi:hypothetical protein